MLKNITLTADSSLIHLARKRAMQDKKSLNQSFREWLARYAGKNQAKPKYQELMKRLSHVDLSDSHFSREEMNER